jgi:hypothetical protein
VWLRASMSANDSNSRPAQRMSGTSIEAGAVTDECKGIRHYEAHEPTAAKQPYSLVFIGKNPWSTG